MRNIIKICGWKLQWVLQSKKIIVLLILTTVFTFALINPLADIAATLGLTLTPFIYPLLVNDHTSHLIVLSGLIFLLAIIDSSDNNHAYVRPRVGLMQYACGELLFLILITFLYQVLLILISLLWIAPVVEWRMEWGDGWRTLAVPSASFGFHRVFLPDGYIIETYSAVACFYKAFYMEWLLLTLLGLIATAFNHMASNASGLICVTFIAFTDMTFYNLFPPIFQAFSPISLVMLSSLNDLKQMQLLDNLHITIYFAIFTAASLLLYFLVETVWIRKRKEGIA